MCVFFLLAQLNLYYNDLGDEGKAVIKAAVSSKVGVTLEGLHT